MFPHHATPFGKSDGWGRLKNASWHARHQTHGPFHRGCSKEQPAPCLNLNLNLERPQRAGQRHTLLRLTMMRKRRRGEFLLRNI